MTPLRDTVGEALAAILDRPARLALNVLGALLGVGALVSTVGLVSTAGAQIVSRFDAIAATEVIVQPQKVADEDAARNVLPFDAEERLGRLDGVVAASTLTSIREVSVRSSPAVDVSAPSTDSVQLFSASPGLLEAVRGTTAGGRWFDQGHSARADAVAVVGLQLARRLNLANIGGVPSISLDDYPYTVIGVLGDVARQPQLLGAVIIPDGSAKVRFDLEAPGSVIIEAEPGAATVVAGHAVLVLAPQAPNQLVVLKAPDVTEVRARVATDVARLFLVLGAISLVVGAIGISNTMLVSVIERTGEIGLRRSLGATRSQIALQFLTESAIIGSLGGILGASAGVLTTVGVSIARSWTPVLALWIPVVAAVIGALVGAVAGLYPAWRAARLQPIDALRTHV